MSIPLLAATGPAVAQELLGVPFDSVGYVLEAPDGLSWVTEGGGSRIAALKAGEAVDIIDVGASTILGRIYPSATTGGSALVYSRSENIFLRVRRAGGVETAVRPPSDRGPGVVALDADRHQIDHLGRIYWATVPDRAGHRALVRALPDRTAPDTVARLEGEPTVPLEGSALIQIGRPFASMDGWGSAPEGVFVVRASPYAVEYYGSDHAARGVVVPYQPTPVTPALKAAFVERVAERLRRIGMGGAGPRIPDAAWPATLPPFEASAIRADAYGRLFVVRTAPAEEAKTCDVFDRTGALVRSFDIPHGARLVGFGPNRVFLARSVDGRDQVLWLPIP